MITHRRKLLKCGREKGVREEGCIMRTEFLWKAIASPDYRNYIVDNQIELSDWDLAIFIYHNKKFSHDEILRFLGELAEKTDDEELKRQIQERISQDMKFYELFKQSAENAFFEISYGKSCYGTFTNFEDAYQAVMEELEPMRIRRVCYDDKEKCKDNRGIWGTIEYYPNGQMCNIFCLYSEGIESVLTKGDMPRFEDRGVDLPLLFRKGDIVYIPHEDIYGVVVAPANDKEEQHTRIYAKQDYGDFQVTVNYLYEAGVYQTISHHGHVSPADIEYAELEEMHRFLRFSAQEICRNNISSKEPHTEEQMDDLLQMIKEIWLQYPNFQLGQLLVNVLGTQDVFHAEDEDLMKQLKKNRFPIGEI